MKRIYVENDKSIEWVSFIVGVLSGACLVALIMAFTSCTKVPLTDVKCYDCLIKQNNGIEYSGVFCVNLEQYQQLMDNENYVITCKEK